MIALLGAALAAPLTLVIGFPSTAVFEGAQRVCVQVTPALGGTDVETWMGGFGATCTTDGRATTACLAVEAGTPWPARFPELVCEGATRELHLRPVPAFDPLDDPADGVCVLRDLARRAAAFRVPQLADAPGILPGGRCGVGGGLLWMEIGLEARRQACVLVQDDGELVVPITLVGDLRRCPDRR